MPTGWSSYVVHASSLGLAFSPLYPKVRPKQPLSRDIVCSIALFHVGRHPHLHLDLERHVLAAALRVQRVPAQPAEVHRVRSMARTHIVHRPDDPVGRKREAGPPVVLSVEGRDGRHVILDALLYRIPAEPDDRVHAELPAGLRPELEEERAILAVFFRRDVRPDGNVEAVEADFDLTIRRVGSGA